MKMLFCTTFLCLVTIIGCTRDDTDIVRKGYLEFDKSITVGQALDNYKYFKTKEWKTLKTEQGRRIVEFRGVYDADNQKIKDESNNPYFSYNRKSVVIQFVINADNTFRLYAGNIEAIVNGKQDKLSFDSNDIKSIYENNL